jgi:hypothetical protein
MIYNWCTFLDYYSVFSSLQAYFLPTHGDGEVPILGKLPHISEFPSQLIHAISEENWHAMGNKDTPTSLGNNQPASPSSSCYYQLLIHMPYRTLPGLRK